MKKWIAPAVFSFTGLVVSLFVYAQLPENMAIHFGPGGNPDNFVSRPVGAFAMPVLIWVMSLLTVISARFRLDETRRRRAESMQQPFLAILGAFLLGVHLFTISYNLGYEINPVKFASVAVGILFLLLGNLAPRMAQAGTMRTWPKLRGQAEKEYGRLQGRLMMGTGFVLIILALLPDRIHALAFFALLFLYAALTFVFALRLSGRTE
jgi:uncharacterized membrane protein